MTCLFLQTAGDALYSPFKASVTEFTLAVQSAAEHASRKQVIVEPFQLEAMLCVCQLEALTAPAVVAKVEASHIKANLTEEAGAAFSAVASHTEQWSERWSRTAPQSRADIKLTPDEAKPPAIAL